MNKRLKETIEKIANRGGQDDTYYVDAYNGTFNSETFGTILTGIDYRCMHFILEYEPQESD